MWLFREQILAVLFIAMFSLFFSFAKSFSKFGLKWVCDLKDPVYVSTCTHTECLLFNSYLHWSTNSRARQLCVQVASIFPQSNFFARSQAIFTFQQRGKVVQNKWSIRKSPFLLSVPSLMSESEEIVPRLGPVGTAWPSPSECRCISFC